MILSLVDVENADNTAAAADVVDRE